MQGQVIQRNPPWCTLPALCAPPWPRLGLALRVQARQRGAGQTATLSHEGGEAGELARAPENTPGTGKQGRGERWRGPGGGSLLPSCRSAGRGHQSLGEGASNAGRRLSGCGGQTALGPHATGTCLLNISRYPQIASGKGGGDSHGCCQHRGCLSPASCLTATGRLRVGQLPGRDHQDCKRAERVRAPTGVLFSEARALTPSHAVLRSCVSLAGGTPCPQGHGPRVPDHDPRPFPQQEPVGLAETAFPSGR